MAFNFNWSPLIADTSRARDMLTNALNKSPKPPIIVDDIIVTELNLGSVPPELEILEIGDLAEDRFRGIFKMSYTGDAFLTLKTRVQANPLNTYLSTKSTFASPQPLAASSGLTIPLQITLSDIRLSGFVILVFSRQKGITLVFRNDPLESLKVSSTFDTIPFVRDYLQKEIEGQLRILFMDDLPAIIHRLSLRMFSPEYQQQHDNAAQVQTEPAEPDPVDPLSSPPQNPFDAFMNPLDDSDLASLNFADSPHQSHATFSRKNLLRLATLTDSHRTLSLFTPPIRDAVFRAWAGAAERGEIANITPLGLGHGLTHAALSRAPSTATSQSGSVYSFSDAASLPSSAPTRPTLSSRPSAYSFNTGAGSSTRGGRPNRKRKHRVVNLRKPKTEEAPPGDISAEGETSSRPTTPTSTTGSSWDAGRSASEPREGELITPPESPEKARERERRERSGTGDRNKTPMAGPRHSSSSMQQQERYSQDKGHNATSTRLQSLMLDERTTPAPSWHSSQLPQHARNREIDDDPHAYDPLTPPQPVRGSQHRSRRPRHLQDSGRTTSLPSSQPALSKPAHAHRGSDHRRYGGRDAGSADRDAEEAQPQQAQTPQSSSSGPAGSILEQAWMMKMANEIARKVREEKEREDSGAARGSNSGKDRKVHPQYRDIYSGMLNEDGEVSGNSRSGRKEKEEVEEEGEQEDLEATIRPRRRFRNMNPSTSRLWDSLGGEKSPPPAYAA